jgi:hypothetical protein
MRKLHVLFKLAFIDFFADINFPIESGRDFTSGRDHKDDLSGYLSLSLFFL